MNLISSTIVDNNNETRSQDHQQSFSDNKYIWLLCYIALASSTGLVGLGHYSQSMYLIAISVIILSLFNPVYATVAVVSYFPADQLLTGLMPGVATPGRYLILYNILIATIALFTHKTPLSKHIKTQFYIYGVLISLAIVSLVWAENISRGILYLGKLLILILWATLAIPLLSSKPALLRLGGGLCLTTTIAALVFIFGDIGRININDRVILEGLGINSIAACFGFSITASAFYIKYAPSKVHRMFATIACVIIYFGILKMGTRSVALGIPLAIFAAGLLLNLRHSPKYLLGACAAVVIFIIALNVAMSSGLISSKLADRYLGLNQVDTYTENSRINLAKWSLGYVFTKNPIGTGAGNENQVFADYKYDVSLYESHNTLLSTMTQFGILGFIILCVALGHLFYIITLIDNTSYRYFVAVLFLFITFQVLKQSLLQTRLYWIPYTVIFSFINYYFISQNNEAGSDSTQKKETAPLTMFNFTK